MEIDLDGNAARLLISVATDFGRCQREQAPLIACPGAVDWTHRGVFILVPVKANLCDPVSIPFSSVLKAHLYDSPGWSNMSSVNVAQPWANIDTSRWDWKKPLLGLV